MILNYKNVIHWYIRDDELNIEHYYEIDPPEHLVIERLHVDSIFKKTIMTPDPILLFELKLICKLKEFQIGEI